MGNGVPLVIVNEPTSSPEIEVHPIQYIALDASFKTLLELEKVDNTRDYDKPISYAVQLALDALVIGSGGVVAYQHTQAAASTSWAIPHNLGRRPSIQIFTVGWVEVLGEIVNTDPNNAQILFDSPQSGFAVLI